MFLISPNPVFGRYIDRVLPDLGERNPEILTWEEFLAPLLPAGRGVGESDVSLERLRAIDAAVASFEFAAAAPRHRKRRRALARRGRSGEGVGEVREPAGRCTARRS